MLYTSIYKNMTWDLLELRFKFFWSLILLQDSIPYNLLDTNKIIMTFKQLNKDTAAQIKQLMAQSAQASSIIRVINKTERARLIWTLDIIKFREQADY